MLSVCCKMMGADLAGIQRDPELNSFSFASLTLSLRQTAVLNSGLSRCLSHQFQIMRDMVQECMQMSKR